MTIEKTMDSLALATCVVGLVYYSRKLWRNNDTNPNV